MSAARPAAPPALRHFAFSLYRLLAVTTGASRYPRFYGYNSTPPTLRIHWTPGCKQHHPTLVLFQSGCGINTTESPDAKRFLRSPMDPNEYLNTTRPPWRTAQCDRPILKQHDPTSMTQPARHSPPGVFRHYKSEPIQLQYTRGHIGSGGPIQFRAAGPRELARSAPHSYTPLRAACLHQYASELRCKHEM